MKPSDPSITWLEEKPLGLAERLYLPLFVNGLTTTARHLVSPKVTVSYPDQRPKVGNPLIYRGVHRLNRDSEGRVKCVACFLCATACPAQPREVSRELPHRRAPLHLLRDVRRGLSG
jgi:NADH-quinone oxidoreductase subunit I